MQGITDTIKDFSSKASDKLGEAGDFLKANPTIAAMLAAGGGAGLLGGYLTSREPEDEQESKTSRRLRILRNALLSAGAGAGAVGLGAYGLNKLNTAIPEGMPHPVQEQFESPLFRGIGAAAGGILGARAGGKMDIEDLASKAIQTLKKDEAEKLIGAAPERLVDYASKNKNFKGVPTGFINFPEFKGKPRDLGRRVLEGSANNLSRALKLILGTSKARQLGMLGAVGGLAVPEVAGTAKDLLIGNY